MRNVTFDTSGSTSSSLLGRVRENDAAAWARLTTIYAPVVYRWARQANLRRADAADLVQEVFQVVSIRINSFDDERAGASFRGWLWGITKNKLHEFFRGCQSQPQATGGTDAQQRLYQLPDTPPEHSDGATGTDATTRLVQRALQAIRGDFSARTWEAFERTTFQGHSAAEIAGELNMSEAAVYKAKSRVLARLREELSGLD
jgi:RNA polymerase sigma-70 factor (ECF subfamily)